MECETNEYVSCTACNSFKAPIDVYRIVQKIIKTLGLAEEEIEYRGEGSYHAGEIEIRCERIEFSWSDYCVRCFVV